MLRRSRSDRHELIKTVGIMLALGVLISIAVFADTPTRELQPAGSWVIVRQASEGRQFLAYKNFGRGTDVDVRPTWTTDPREAWEYGAVDSVLADIQVHGGMPMQYREVYP